MESTEALTCIQVREQGTGIVEWLKVEPGATFRDVLNACDFIDRPDEYVVCYRLPDGSFAQPELDAEVADYCREHNQEFIVAIMDG